MTYEETRDYDSWSYSTSRGDYQSTRTTKYTAERGNYRSSNVKVTTPKSCRRLDRPINDGPRSTEEHPLIAKTENALTTEDEEPPSYEEATKERIVDEVTEEANNSDDRGGRWYAKLRDVFKSFVSNQTRQESLKTIE